MRSIYGSRGITTRGAILHCLEGSACWAPSGVNAPIHAESLRAPAPANTAKQVGSWAWVAYHLHSFNYGRSSLRGHSRYYTSELWATALSPSVTIFRRCVADGCALPKRGVGSSVHANAHLIIVASHMWLYSVSGAASFEPVPAGHRAGKMNCFDVVGCRAGTNLPNKSDARGSKPELDHAHRLHHE